MSKLQIAIEALKEISKHKDGWGDPSIIAFIAIRALERINE